MWDPYGIIMAELDGDLSDAACSLSLGDDKFKITDLLLIQLIRTIKKMEAEAPVTKIYFREESTNQN